MTGLITNNESSFAKPYRNREGVQPTLWIQRLGFNGVKIDKKNTNQLFYLGFNQVGISWNFFQNSDGLNPISFLKALKNVVLELNPEISPSASSV